MPIEFSYDEYLVPFAVQSAPPTQVLVDPQSADVQTDLAGLATGGGIGVLATLAGVAPGNVDLIAPVGVIDAGRAPNVIADAGEAYRFRSVGVILQQRRKLFFAHGADLSLSKIMSSIS